MKQYLKAQNKINEIILDGTVKVDEVHRFSTADFRWANNQNLNLTKRKPKKGEIYQFEFGKNYKPEMSYEHRGLIMGQKGKMVYALPICSYNPSKHADAFHPVDNPDSKSDMYLLKSTEFDFIKHDSVLKLNDIRSVSVNRILYKHSGRILPSSDTYKKIESLVLQKYFSDFYYELEKCKEEIEKLILKNSSLYEENESLKEKLNTIQQK